MMITSMLVKTLKRMVMQMVMESMMLIAYVILEKFSST